MFDAINLDEMDLEERIEAAQALAIMVKYAKKKNMATRHRINGNIQLALALEVELERIYQELPEWAQW